MKIGGGLALILVAALGAGIIFRSEGASAPGPQNQGPLPPPANSGAPAPTPKLTRPARLEPLEEVDRRAEILVERGLAAIVEAQNGDGSFGGEAGRKVRLALSAICTLALLADANTEFRGRHHVAVTRGLKFLLDSRHRGGPTRGYFQADGDVSSRMHGHAFATLALSQGYGMFGIKRRFSRSSDEMREALSEAVALITRSQTRAGGWGYEPNEKEVDEGSLTVCMLQALRGARNVGIAVDPKVVRRALDYIRNSQKNDGSIRYSLHGDNRSSFELTAAGAATLIHGGDYFAPALRRARTLLWDGGFETFIGRSGRTLGKYPYYGIFYAIQVLMIDHDAAQARRLNRYYPRIVAWFEGHYDAGSNRYLHHERPFPAELEYGPLYRTALATLSLQIRHGALPIFAR
jgi:hypothetical protein